MNDKERKKAAKEFSLKWKGRGQEDQDTQSFWDELLQKVFDVETPNEVINYQKRVKINEHTKRIDGYIDETLTLIEQKSFGISLTKPLRQGDGEILTAYEQADRYAKHLPHSENPRWIVTCNFDEFRIYDRNHLGDPPEIVKLENLEKEYGRLNFLLNQEDEHIQKEMGLSVQAGEIVGKLYDAFYKQYEVVRTPTEEDKKSLNELCVRLVFCFYAEDAGIFGQKDMFYNYLSQFDAISMRTELIRLFQILDTKEEDRDPYLREDLLEFPYVNGGLFENESIIIPQFTDEIKSLILEEASKNFDWSEISPTIFGAVFESTLNPETRRSGGMHYTSIENIHKVIDPLFLNELQEEFTRIKSINVIKKRTSELEAFQKKLASLTWLDPAAGSGNFLTETYLSIRRLENKVLEERINAMRRGKDDGGVQTIMGTEKNASPVSDPIQVTIGQFFGIEINDFAVSVAKTAMWIAESQMMEQTCDILHHNIDFLPLTANANIVEGNALRMDWEDVVPSYKLKYIMGNPPFVGSSRTDSKNEQKADMLHVFGKDIKHGKLDYVAGWYWKAAKYIQGTTVRCAFVSTNSITQGEQVALLWKPLFDQQNIEINYAYRSFPWSSEATENAAVVCVIIGFSMKGVASTKRIFTQETFNDAEHINGYLLDMPDLYIQSRGDSLHGMPKIVQGNKPWDGGHLIMSEGEYLEFISKYPQKSFLIRPFYGGDELLKDRRRYCLWLKDIDPSEYVNIPEIKTRLQGVRDARLNTRTAAVRQQADTPALFSQIRHPETDYLAIPEVSTALRRYIPIGFLTAEDIASNKLFIIPNATLYLFGVLISNVHMAWMRVVSGRLGTGYSYSPSVYNNFPWPSPTSEQKVKIEQTAAEIINARANHPNLSLAQMYDQLYMPKDLQIAHENNNKAVWEAYGKAWSISSETECIAYLMKMYQKLIEE